MIYPRELPDPEHGFYAVPTRGPHAALAARYLDAMHNAANFAFGNRLFLGLMAVRAPGGRCRAASRATPTRRSTATPSRACAW